MFFKKKREAKKAAILAERQKILDGFREQLVAAANIADAGEKILKLDALQAAIRDKIEGIASKIEKNAGDRGFLVALGGTGIALGGTALAVTAFLLPPGIIVCGGLAGVFPGILLGKKNKRTVEKILTEENSAFVGALESQRRAVRAAADETLNGPLEAIVRSSKRDEVFKKYPDLQKRFADAVAKKFLEDVPAPKPADGKPGLNL